MLAMLWRGGLRSGVTRIYHRGFRFPKLIIHVKGRMRGRPVG